MAYLFNWDATFLTGLRSIDEQHQRLIGLINELGELVTDCAAFDDARYTSVRSAVADYIQVHFGDEEGLMESCALDPRFLTLHRRAHRDFVAEIEALSRPGAPSSLAQARQLAEYLIEWLAYHILGIDQAMARQMRAIDGGVAPQQAYAGDEYCTPSGAEPLLGALRVLFETVSRRNAELRALNGELEQRVRLRTAELERANSRLHVLSTLDDLTGLPNRRFAVLAMHQQWEEAKRYRSPLAVLMVDADHFKEVNDRFGHAEGDSLLRGLARRLRQSVRTSDIVCRLGGDEFLLICPHTTSAGAEDVGRKILAHGQPFFTAERVECWNGSVSIGIAQAEGSMGDVDELLKAADRAMYAAKQLGGATLMTSGARPH